MSTTVVAPGPGAAYADEGTGWESADVSLRYEATSPKWESGGDTVALLQLDADVPVRHGDTRKMAIQCELTLDDCIELRERLSQVIATRTGMLP